jgi:hypothetical protein
MLLRYTVTPVRIIQPEECPYLLSKADRLEQRGNIPGAEAIYRLLISKQSVPAPFKHAAAKQLVRILIRAKNRKHALIVLRIVKKLFPLPGNPQEIQSGPDAGSRTSRALYGTSPCVAFADCPDGITIQQWVRQ